ncbi:MAG: hypothetical protein PSV35_01735, partial [bacterium]|nr:hypothetical protein [bacterium]
SPNVQPLSNAYFHGINLEEIGAFINGAGGICARRKTIGTAPVVGLPNNIHIPASTPFILTASASGPGHKSYTYGWEQMNNAVSTQPPSTYSIDGPNFRSITPTLNNTRFFPKLTNLVHNGPYTWEVLSAVSRIMDFRITVRRNQPGGSCNAYQDTRVLIDGNSGPFHLTYPKNQGLHLTGLSLQNVTWTVANTNLPPVNAATVDLLLSTDGGLTYPITIVQNIPNNGSAPIFIPNVDTSTARIMIRSSNKTFFAISAYNFSITSIIPQPIIAPKLSGAVRNPLNKNNVFIYYTNLGNVAPYDHYILNGVKATSIRLDKGKGYFVVTQINTPRSVKNVTLTILRPAQPNVKTNSITIPGIL